MKAIAFFSVLFLPLVSQAQNHPAVGAPQTGGGVHVEVTREPTLLLKSGNVSAGTEVRIKCPTHYAAIYFTTNGWVPTAASQLYSGPIKIESTMELQAIAIAPDMKRSLIARASYTMQGSTAAPIVPLPLPAGGVLALGTKLELVTGSTASSKNAQVGDTISVLLNQDIKSGETVLAPKGTPVPANITLADHSQAGGGPGDLAFEVHSLTVNGIVIPLSGGETLEGADRHKSQMLMVIPGIGMASAAIHGVEAQITPGMGFTATVAKEIQLHP